MKPVCILSAFAMVVACSPVAAQDPNTSDVHRADTWTKELTDRTKRGTLHDAFQRVRGDSGKWNDEAAAILAPSIKAKSARVSLDDWYEELAEAVVQAVDGEDNWLLLRTRQLNDNDRAWVQRIERRGDEFTISISEAVWQGNYRKNFTYYNVFGVSLGQLPAGDYKANVIIQPLVFTQFEGPNRPAESWSKDERRSDAKPVRLTVAFSITAPSD